MLYTWEGLLSQAPCIPEHTSSGYGHQIRGKRWGAMPSPLCKTLAQYPSLCQYDHGSCNGKTMHACIWQPLRASPPVLALHLKIGWREVNICRFGSGKWFVSCTCAQFPEAGESLSKALQRLEKSAINMIWWLSPVFDWPNIVIKPGGLLLVVPTYLQYFLGGIAKK